MDHLKDPDKLKAALAVAVRSGDDLSRAGILLALARLHSDHGRPGAAVEAWTEASGLCSAAGELPGLAEAEVHLGAAALAASDFQLAAEHLMRALHCGGLDENNLELVARLKHNLGLCHLRLGAYTLAIAAYREAIEAWRGASQVTGLARSLVALGESLRLAGDLRLAAEALEEGVGLLEASPEAEPADRGLALELLAETQVGLGEVDPALDSFAKAAAAWGVGGASEDRRRCLLRQVTTQLDSTDRTLEPSARGSSALRSYLQAALEADDAAAVAFARFHLATSLVEGGDLATATDVVLALSDDADARGQGGRGDELRRWAADLEVAQMERAQGEDRRSALNRAEALLVRVGDREGINACRWALVALEQEEGDLAALASALERLDPRDNSPEILALAAAHRAAALASLGQYDLGRGAAQEALGLLGPAHSETRQALEVLVDALAE